MLLMIIGRIRTSCSKNVELSQNLKIFRTIKINNYNKINNKVYKKLIAIAVTTVIVKIVARKNKILLFNLKKINSKNNIKFYVQFVCNMIFLKAKLINCIVDINFVKIVGHFI